MVKFHQNVLMLENFSKSSLPEKFKYLLVFSLKISKLKVFRTIVSAFFRIRLKSAFTESLIDKNLF